MASTEKSRASAAAMNAEVRRTKARLMDEVPKLRKLALKKVNFHWFFFFNICYKNIRPLLNLGIVIRYINMSYSEILMQVENDIYSYLWFSSYLILVPIMFKIPFILTQFFFFGMKFMPTAKTM
jgi:hypothetical protein